MSQTAFTGIQGMFSARDVPEKCYAKLKKQSEKMTPEYIFDFLENNEKHKGAIPGLEFEIQTPSRKILLMFVTSIGNSKDGILVNVFEKAMEKDYGEVIFIVVKGVTGGARSRIRSFQNSTLHLADKPVFQITLLNFERMLFDVCTNMYQPQFHPIPVINLLDFPDTPEGKRDLYIAFSETPLVDYIPFLPHSLRNESGNPRDEDSDDSGESSSTDSGIISLYEFVANEYSSEFPKFVSTKLPLLFISDPMIKRMGYRIGDIVRVYQPLFTPTSLDNTNPGKFGVRSADARLTFKMVVMGN